MHQSTTRRTRTATAADFHRLADVAHERGLEVIQDAQGMPFVEAAPLFEIATERCISCTNGKIEEWGVSGPIGCKPCPVCGGSGRLPMRSALLPEPRRIPLVAA